MGLSNRARIHRWLGKPYAYPQTIDQQKKFQRLGEHNALTLFHAAAVRIPAYKDFLRSHKIIHTRIKTIKDFTYIPITTKENYVEAYDIEDRVWDGKMAQSHMISTSSGTTGVSMYWPRSLEHEIDGAIVHEFFLRSEFHVDKKSTLFINGFALGNWIAGTFTQSAMQLVAWKGYPITLMSPGYNLEAILSVVKDVSPLYEQTIITGHTPFLKEVVEAIVAKNLHTGNVINLLGTGQGITESWRAYIGATLRRKTNEHTVVNLYGSADASLMGFETPTSIDMRKWIEVTNKTKELFNDVRLPSLYQYDAQRIYFEAIHGELCITKNGGSPLVRYNIHDAGGVYRYEDLMKTVPKVKRLSMEKKYPWKLPFVYLFGRDKFMVKLYGANIYVEHVQKVVDHPRVQTHLTGRFILEVLYDSHENPTLYVRIESRSPKIESNVIPEDLVKIFVSEVSKINSEYKFITETMGKKAYPHIVIYPHGYSKYFPKNVTKKTS